MQSVLLETATLGTVRRLRLKAKKALTELFSRIRLPFNVAPGPVQGTAQ
jgi:hypothetical protein